MPDATRFEVDTALHNAIARGGVAKLAEHRGVKHNNVAKYYNPHDEEYQSIFSKALLELQVISRVCPQWARSVLQVFNSYGAKWCGESKPKQSGGVLQDIIQTAAKLLDPDTPISDRMALAMKLHADAGKVVDGLRCDGLDDADEENPMRKAAVKTNA
jgi:hypothetical protein